MSKSPEARAKIGAGVRIARRRILAWCPPDRLDEYKRLAHKTSAAEARRMIEASMTPFERQLQAVRNGASITELPRMRAAEPTVSYVGISEVYSG